MSVILMTMVRGHGMGLRAQIVITLILAFALSFPLLGVAAVQLTQRAREADRIASVRATARLFVAAMGDAPDSRRDAFERLGSQVVGAGGIVGAELVRGDLPPIVIGAAEMGTQVEADLGDGSAIRLWVHAQSPDASSPLTNILLLYVSVTAGAVVIFAFFLITHLIVRPLDALTRASERIAAGKLEVNVPVRGGAELASLAISFNAMSAQLRADRSALEERLHELEQTTTKLESARDQVIRSAKLDSVGRLSAGIAHEIGNPLAAILGMVELLRTAELGDDERGELLGRMQSETERIGQIIRDLLDFSRRGSVTDDPTMTKTADLEPVIRDAVRLVEPQQRLRGVEILLDLETALPHVRGTPGQLTQVILNLLLNATDAMDGKGNVEMNAWSNEDEGSVIITVRDQGPGIDESVLKTIFEPFVTTKEPGDGTGLGLAVCNTIVQRFGGTIHAENSPEGGAIFTVRLSIKSPQPSL